MQRLAPQSSQSKGAWDFMWIKSGEAGRVLFLDVHHCAPCPMSLYFMVPACIMDLLQLLRAGDECSQGLDFIRTDLDRQAPGRRRQAAS